MGLSLLQLLEDSGYKVTTNYRDAKWLRSKKREIRELMEAAENLIEVVENEPDK